MFAPLRWLLARLDLPDTGTNRNDRLLNWITLAIILITVLYSGLFVFIIGNIDVALIGLCAVVLAVGINIAVRNGHSRVATVSFVFGIWLIVTYQDLRPGALGVFDNAFAAYIVPILLAGVY